MPIQYATAIDVGNLKRQHDGINEDSVAVNLLEDAHLDTTRQAGVFVLADGAGGEEAGDIASYIATVEVTRALTRALWDVRRFHEIHGDNGPDASGRLDDAVVSASPPGVDADWLLARIDDAIQLAHRRILETVRDLPLESAYSTIVAGIQADARLYYGWVGDSRAYVINHHPDRAADDRICSLTRDHSVVEQLVQQGEINEIEARVHRRGTQITRALGGTREDDPDGAAVAVDTNHVDLFGDDTVMFTSDGLLDAYANAPELHEQYQAADSPADVERQILEKTVTEDEICDIVLDAATLDDAADRLVTLANQRGGKDNISLILFREPALPPSPAGGLPVRAHDRPPEDVDDLQTVIGDPDF